MGQAWDDDTRIVLFVRIADGVELDDALRRQTKKRCGPHGIARHQHKQLLAPHRHARAFGDDDRFATEEVDHVFRIHIDALIARHAQRLRNVRILHETVLRTHVIDAIPVVLHRDLILRRHIRHRRRRHHQHDHVLVQDLVVPKIVSQRRRRTARLRGHEDGSAGHPRGWCCGNR